MRIFGTASIEDAYLFHIQSYNCLFPRQSDYKSSSFECGFDNGQYLNPRRPTAGIARLSVGFGQFRSLNGLPYPDTAYIYEDRIGITILGKIWSIPTGGRFVDPMYRGECGPPAVGGSQQSATVSYELYIDVEERFRPNDDYLDSGGSNIDYSELRNAFQVFGVPGTLTFSIEPRIGGKAGGRVIYNGEVYENEVTITATNASTTFQHILSPYCATSATVHNKHSYRSDPYVPAAGFPPDATPNFPSATCSYTANFAIGTGGSFTNLNASLTAAGGSQISTNVCRANAVQVLAYKPVGINYILPGEYYGTAYAVYLMRPRQEIEIQARLLDGAGGPLANIAGDWQMQIQDARFRPPLLSQEFTAPNGSGSIVQVRENRNLLGGINEGSGAPIDWSYNPTWPSIPGPFTDYPAVVIKKEQYASAAYPLTKSWLRRLTMRGRSWPTRHIGHRLTRSYGRDNSIGSPPGAWNLANVTTQVNVTKSIVGGMLRLETSAGFVGGRAADILGGTTQAEYRFFRARWRRVGATGGEMEVRRGPIVLAGTPSLFRLPAASIADAWQEAEGKDLLAPDSPAPPLPDAAAGSFAPGASPGNKDLQIHLPAGAGVWEIDYLQGYRRSFAAYSYLAASCQEEGEHLALCVDGMSLAATNGAAVRFTPVPVPGGKPWSGRPWDWIGWTGSGVYSLSYWMSSDNDAWEGGNGYGRNGSSLQFSAGLSAGAEETDASGNSDPVIVNTEVWDAAWLYPGIGDPFGGAFGERTTLTFAQILSPSVRGVLNTDGDTTPAVGVFTDPGGTREGLADPTSSPGGEFPEGYFSVGGALSVGNKKERLIPESDPADRVPFTVGASSGGSVAYGPRSALYLLLQENEAGQGISASVSPTGRLVAADTAGGKIRLSLASAAARVPGGGAGGSSAWLRVETPESGTRPAVVCADDGRIVLAWEVSGEIKGGYTIDEGKTIGGIVTVFTGTGYSHPAVCKGPTQLFYYFSLQDPGGGGSRRIRAKVYDGAGNAIGAGPGGATEWTVAGASNIADDDLAAICPEGGEIILMYRDATSGALLSLVSTDGVNFS